MSTDTEDGQLAGSAGEEERERETFERDIVRNSRRYTAVFHRIYDKYDREYESDEPGGEILTNNDLQDFTEEEEEEEERRSGIRGRQLSCLLPDSVATSDSEKDEELTALLHEKVVKVKREVCWDEEEERLRERKNQRRKPPRVADGPFSSETETESSDSEGMRQPIRQRRRRRRKRKRRQWKSGRSSAGGDVSETLYETEWDPSHVQSEPEERNWSTPPPQLGSPRDAYSTPRMPRRRRRRSAQLQARVVAELDKRLPAPISDPGGGQNSDEGVDGFVSGYDSTSDYLSGYGDVALHRHTNSESDTLEYVGTPDHALVDGGRGSPELLSPPPPLSPSRFDENLPIVATGKREGEEGGRSLIPFQNPDSQQDEKECEFCQCAFYQAPTDGGSHDKSRDGHMTASTVVNNMYTNVTYVTYCTGAAPLSNCPSCSQCCAAQYFGGCHAHTHHPPCPYCHQHSHSHPPHFTTAPTTTHCSCFPSHNLADPKYDPPAPDTNPVTKKRKLDGEQSDPLPDGAEPLPKKQCH